MTVCRTMSAGSYAIIGRVPITTSMRCSNNFTLVDFALKVVGVGSVGNALLHRIVNVRHSGTADYDQGRRIRFAIRHRPRVRTARYSILLACHRATPAWKTISKMMSLSFCRGLSRSVSDVQDSRAQ